MHIVKAITITRKYLNKITLSIYNDRIELHNKYK